MKKLICIASMAIVAVAMSAQQHKLWYNKPASHWLEALPIGNSHLGAMVYGGTETEERSLIVFAGGERNRHQHKKAGKRDFSYFLHFFNLINSIR